MITALETLAKGIVGVLGIVLFAILFTIIFVAQLILLLVS